MRSRSSNQKKLLKERGLYIVLVSSSTPPISTSHKCISLDTARLLQGNNIHISKTVAYILELSLKVTTSKSKHSSMWMTTTHINCEQVNLALAKSPCLKWAFLGIEPNSSTISKISISCLVGPKGLQTYVWTQKRKNRSRSLAYFEFKKTVLLPNFFLCL